jgi:hypothetical protein
MASASFLTLFVVSPVRLGLGDVTLLTLLRSAGQQDYELLTILAKIHPVSGAKVDPPLAYAFANRFHITETADFDPGNGGADFGGCAGVEALEPVGERAGSICGFVLNNLNQSS